MISGTCGSASTQSECRGLPGPRHPVRPAFCRTRRTPCRSTRRWNHHRSRYRRLDFRQLTLVRRRRNRRSVRTSRKLQSAIPRFGRQAQWREVRVATHVSNHQHACSPKMSRKTAVIRAPSRSGRACLLAGVRSAIRASGGRAVRRWFHRNRTSSTWRIRFRRSASGWERDPCRLCPDPDFPD